VLSLIIKYGPIAGGLIGDYWVDIVEQVINNNMGKY
jgi:hypothetical protein